MRLIDEQYTVTPFYGYRRMTVYLQNLGFVVNHKRVRRLMRKLGLEAIYPKPNLSKPGKDHLTYPYLLKGAAICVFRSGPGDRHHLPQNRQRIHLFTGDYGLAFPIRH